LPDVIEFLESRSIQTSGGRGTGTRVFHVTGTTSVRTVHNLLGKAGDNGVEMPNVGDAHPDFPGSACEGLLGVARRWSQRHLAGRLDIRGHQPRLPAIPDDGHHGASERGRLPRALLGDPCRVRACVAEERNAVFDVSAEWSGHEPDARHSRRASRSGRESDLGSAEHSRAHDHRERRGAGVVDLSILPVLSQLGQASSEPLRVSCSIVEHR
jgi:hypothetical protein